jgi:hypothetical protein
MLALMFCGVLWLILFLLLFDTLGTYRLIINEPIHIACLTYLIAYPIVALAMLFESIKVRR